eukprot:4990995-Pleurochrysis_carterae.AAC.1
MLARATGVIEDGRRTELRRKSHWNHTGGAGQGGMVATWGLARCTAATATAPRGLARPPRGPGGIVCATLKHLIRISGTYCSTHCL